jgi:thioredoxin-related protein
MNKKIFALIFIFFALNLYADFKEGKKLFNEKCSSCHKGYISFSKLKENFIEKNNTLLNLKIPTENMLVWAILDSKNKIGTKEDEEMRVIEIADFLKEYLAKPDLSQSVCDSHVIKYYEKKEPMKISEKEAALIAEYFIGYNANGTRRDLTPSRKLAINYDEKKILKEAKNSNKHIIVYAMSKTCYFCKKMSKEVLSLDEVKKAINKNYFFIKIDIDDTKLPFGLQKNYKGMTPTFFILSKDGKLQNTYPGAWVKSDFFEILKENL